jgi:hypothetical protein
MLNRMLRCPSDNLQEVKAERKPVVVNGPSNRISRLPFTTDTRGQYLWRCRGAFPLRRVFLSRSGPSSTSSRGSPPLPRLPSTTFRTRTSGYEPHTFSPGPGRPLHPGLVSKSMLSVKSPASNVTMVPLVDPFATPFDDSNAVKPQRQPPQTEAQPKSDSDESLLESAGEAWRSSTNGNSLAPVAL